MPMTNECPGCGQMYNTHIKICVPCEINLETGEPMGATEQLEAEVEVEPSSAKKYGVLAIQFCMAYFPGLLRPGLMIAILLVGLLGLAGVMYGLSMIVDYGIVMSGSAVIGFSMLIFAQAVSWLFMGEFGFLIDGLVEFDAIHWNLFFLALAGPAVFVFFMMKNAALAE